LHAKVLPEIRADEKSRAWVETFYNLGEKLGFHVERN
jgi:hypothetical protein